MSLTKSIERLVSALHDSIDEGTNLKEAPLERRFGIVTAVSPRSPTYVAGVYSAPATIGSITVTLAGNSITVNYIAQYQPAIGDKCLILQEGRDMVAIGSL